MRVPVSLLCLVVLVASCSDDAPETSTVSLTVGAFDSAVNITPARTELAKYLEVLVGEAPADGGRATLEVAFEAVAGLDDGFELNAVDVGERTRLTIGCGSTLGCQYGAYEVARRLGARFFHPEDEWLPRIPKDQLRTRAKTPTALGPGPRYAPDFRHRSWTFHGAHPLEHLESFGDARFPIDEAERVNRWMIKNRGDLSRGAGRSNAPPAELEKRRAELDALHQELGLDRGAGITLHNQQQGASADLDLTSDVSIRDQIDAFVKRIADTRDYVPYSFGIHFGPTELTTTPDRETVEWINWAGEAAQKYFPGIPVEVNDHISGRQPTEHYDDLGCPSGTNESGTVDYYDLVFHTDPRWAARVHTVMFYPLEGPALVYGQKTFAHKLCLIEKAQAQGRPIVWFPEGAYWLSIDNTVPVYLPLYLWTRHRDIELVRPFLTTRGGTVQDHRMFNSGQEWGYWQQDYGVGLWGWNADATLDDALAEMADPLCAVEAWPASCAARDEYVAVLREVMDQQRADFLEAEDFRGRAGGLYWYFGGEDPADEIGAVSGLELRPVKVAFRDIATLPTAERQRFVNGDLATIGRIEGQYAAWVARLEAVRDAVPEAGRPWLDEVVDGLAINRARAAHTRLLFEVTLALMAGEDTAGKLAAARAEVEAARVIITRREAHYRYPLAQEIGRGPNGTTYPWRVHTKTHELSYWENRQAQVQDLVDGSDAEPTTLVVEPVFADPGVPVTLTWPALDGLSGVVDMGDGTTVGLADAAHTYEGAGVFTVSGALEVGGAPLSVRGVIARTTERAKSSKGDFELVEPSSDLAKTVLGSLVPGVRVALTADALAFVAEPGGFGTAPFTSVASASLTRDGASFTSGGFAFELPIPDPSTGRVASNVTVSDATLSGPVSLDGVVELVGQLEIRDLVDTLVTLAGFEEQGAMETLASVLGFDPADPPERVPFRARITVAAE